MRNKVTYIADIFDITWGPKNVVAIGKPIKEKRYKIASNNRHKLFCKCGGSIEFEMKDKLVPVPNSDYEIKGKRWYPKVLSEAERNATGIYGYKNVPNEFEPVTCPSCSVIYDSFEQATRLSPSRNYSSSNIISVRSRVFENEKTLALCCYATMLVVNQHTKRLITQDIKSSISLNKKWRFATRIFRHSRGGQKIRRFGLRNIAMLVESTIKELPGIQIDNIRKGTTGYTQVESEIIFVVEEFCNRLLGFINPKDADKIKNMLSDQRKKLIKIPEMPDDVLEDSDRAIIAHQKYDFLIKHQLPTTLSVALYPPMATVFFTKGIKFTLDMLSSWVMPPTSTLKKEMPTSPIKILESILRNKLINDSTILRRHINNEKKKADGLSTSKTEYMYDPRIPSDITRNDKRFNFINISKKVYRNMQNPKSIELFIILSLQRCLTVSDAEFLINKYGIDMCHTILGDINFEVFQNFVNGVHKSRPKEIEHMMKLVDRFYIEDKTPTIQLDGSIKYKCDAPPISLYVDTLRMLGLLQRNSKELMETKNFDEVSILHDKLLVECRLLKNELLSKKVTESMSKFQHMNCDIGTISFRVLDKVSELQNESDEMRHCVSTYAEYVARGQCIILRIIDSADGSRATMSCSIGELENKTFDQLKAICNKKATNNIQRATHSMLLKNKIMLSHSSLMPSGDLGSANIPLDEMILEKSYGDTSGGRDNINLPF